MLGKGPAQSNIWNSLAYFYYLMVVKTNSKFVASQTLNQDGTVSRISISIHE